ncbi:MAG: TIGR03546 family protein [Candidatus Omnitrophota bacterium]|jgi:uncharacterized protein (TIGR03546 family)
MFSFTKIPAQFLSFLLGLRITSNEVALGICLGMFLGFVPLNNVMALFLLLLFMVVRLNRLSTLLVLPFFKLLYVLFVSNLTDKIGGYLLIDAKYLTKFWSWFTELPVIALLDFNNTLVCGGIALSLVLSPFVYFISRKLYTIYVEKYVRNFRQSKFIKKIMQNNFINKIILTMERIRSKTE